MEKDKIKSMTEKRYYRLLSKKAKAIIQNHPIWNKKSAEELSRYLFEINIETKSITCINYLENVFSINQRRS
jgi:hypothetical protein